MRLLPFGELFAVLMIVFLIIALSSGYSPEERYERKVEAPEMLVLESLYDEGIVNIDSLLGLVVDDVFYGVNSVGFRASVGGVKTFFQKSAYDYFYHLDAKVQLNDFYVEPLDEQNTPQVLAVETRRAVGRIVVNLPPLAGDTEHIHCPVGRVKGGFCHVLLLTFEDFQDKSVESCAGVINEDSFVALHNRCHAISQTVYDGLRMEAPKDNEVNTLGVSFAGFDGVSRRAIAMDAGVFRKESKVKAVQGLYCRFPDTLSPSKNARVGGLQSKPRAQKFSLNMKYDPNVVKIAWPKKEEFKNWLKKVSVKNVQPMFHVRVLTGAPFSEKVYVPAHDDIEGTIFRSEEACKMAYVNSEDGHGAFVTIKDDIAIKTFAIEVSPRLKAGSGLKEEWP